ncbi:MAG: hypothetical protein IJT15_02355 [Rickettsiales bacterium]|nr:hypothetical protein [Rickettsiales bacterium]
MQQQNNYHYTFDELRTYLFSCADLFQQDRVQDGIHLYSKNAKKVYEEMLKVENKIQKTQNIYQKALEKKRAEMADAIQKYTKKHRDDKDFEKKMSEDPKIKQYTQEIKNLEEQLNGAIKYEQDKFMQWEKNEMKGRNTIMRNNNYISAAGKSNAIKKGLIGSNEIASFGNVNIKNSKNETISGNLADIVHSVTNLLHQKAQTEKDEAKKSEIEKVIQMIINGVKDFFGIQKDNKKQLEEQSNQLNVALQTIIKTYLDNNFKQVQTNLDVIKQKNEQGKINYQSMTKDTSDLRSDLSTLEKNDIVSQLTQVLDGKNETQAIDNKGKQVSTSASQNTQQTNINEQNNNNKNINTTKLLDKKEAENKTNKLKNNNIKNAFKKKDKENEEEKEISTEELDKLANEKFDNESKDINQGKLSDPKKQNEEELEDEPADEHIAVVPKDNTDKLNAKFISASDIDQINKNENKAKNIKISIDQHNSANIKPQLLNNGKKEVIGAQIGGGGNGSK